jgi:hypothetical protein
VVPLLAVSYYCIRVKLILHVHILETNRAFLGKADKFFPLEESNISIVPELFEEGARAYDSKKIYRADLSKDA